MARSLAAAGEQKDDGRKLNRSGDLMLRSFAYLLAAIAIASAPVAQADEYKAKIALEDGTSFRTNPMILPTRSGICAIRNLFGDGNLIYVTRYYSPMSGMKASDECPVMIRLTGYRNVETVLHSGAVIILKRNGGREGEGSMVSMSTLNAPKDAQKAYEQGVDAMLKNKWPAAQQRFQAAVAIYPKYAPAWTDLGEVLLRQSKPEEAQAAYKQAIEADPKFVKPYVELARLAIGAGRTEEGLAIAAKGIELNSTQFPALYLYSALGHFTLNQLDPAEKAARRLIELDVNHIHPGAERLLGRILYTKGDRPGATEHLKKYLELAPNAPDKQDIQKRLEEIERASVPKQ
jgi:tetratricopeptide (TPR) repeat protein